MVEKIIMITHNLKGCNIPITCNNCISNIGVQSLIFENKDNKRIILRKGNFNMFFLKTENKNYVIKELDKKDNLLKHIRKNNGLIFDNKYYKLTKLVKTDGSLYIL